MLCLDFVLLILIFNCSRIYLFWIWTVLGVFSLQLYIPRFTSHQQEKVVIFGVYRSESLVLYMQLNCYTCKFIVTDKSDSKCHRQKWRARINTTGKDKFCGQLQIYWEKNWPFFFFLFCVFEAISFSYWKILSLAVNVKGLMGWGALRQKHHCAWKCVYICMYEWLYEYVQ